MKFVNIILPKNDESIPGSTWSAKNQKLLYPAGWDLLQKYIISHMYYYDEDKVFNLLLSVSDDAAIPNHKNIKIISREEMIKISEKNCSPLERITDPAKIERIKIKVALGKKLTKDEEDAIDIDSDVPGFSKSKPWHLGLGRFKKERDGS